MKTQSPTPKAQDPAALRSVFGDNLRKLCEGHASVSGVCRALGINRTQFNRYMSGESFPRPDVLYRICAFFEVDSRILLEPVEEITATTQDLLNHPYLTGFFSQATTYVPEEFFPSGIYRFARQGFLDPTKVVLGLVLISRQNGYTFLRGFEPRNALRAQGLSTHLLNCEYRGIVLRQEEGVMAVVTHRDALACSFNFLTPETSFQSNIWEGYASRTIREKVTGARATRMIYEHLGNETGRILDAARKSGVVTWEDVPPYYVHLLRPNEAFR